MKFTVRPLSPLEWFQMSRLLVPHSVGCVAMWVTSHEEPTCNTAIPNTNNNNNTLGGV